MEMKKIGSILADAGNSAKDALDKAKEKTILAVDQNNDGKFDIDDVSVVANALGNAVKKGAAAVKDSAEEGRRKMDLKLLQPIFPDTVESADFLLSKFIRITDRDKKHAEGDGCQGSIGFLSEKGGLRIVNLFNDSLDSFGLSFYPDADCEFYYVNPTDRDSYIALDDYFSYMKMVRINELQRVAQALGAKHFRVTYKEERTAFSEERVKAQTKVKPLGTAEGNHHALEKKFSMIDVAAEMSMEGHAPEIPKLVYLAKDDNVKNLIQLRMTGGEGFHHHKISIKMSNSSGIKENDALKIDAALKGMKISGNATVSNEVRNESRRYLEYEIDF